MCAGPSYKNNSSLAVLFSIAAYGILNSPTVIEMCCPLVDKGYYLGIWVLSASASKSNCVYTLEVLGLALIPISCEHILS